MLNRSRITFRAVLMLMPAVIALAACGGANSSTLPAATAHQTQATVAETDVAAAVSTAATSRLKVVATFSVLGDLVHNVAADLVELKTLVPAGGDAHTFEPSPADSVTLAEADLVFENGLDFESWLPDLFTAAHSRARRVVVSEGIDPLTATEEEHHAQEGDEDGDHHGGFDPHVWHDVDNAIHMVEHIRDRLVAADLANADAYRANAERYLQQLKQLDAFVVDRVNNLPPERRKLVTTHDTFGYFARRYGFELVGTALGSVSTEVADPAAADIAALVEQIKATGVPAIFTENIESGSLTERIAHEAGVALAPVLYTDALDDPGSNGESYEKMIRYNVETIVMALSK